MSRTAGGGRIVNLDHRAIPGTKLADLEYYLDRVRRLSECCVCHGRNLHSVDVKIAPDP